MMQKSDIGRTVSANVEIHGMTQIRKGTVIEVYPYCFIVDFGYFRCGYPHSALDCDQVRFEVH